jgi:hypothetical protein
VPERPVDGDVCMVHPDASVADVSASVRVTAASTGCAKRTDSASDTATRSTPSPTDGREPRRGKIRRAHETHVMTNRHGRSEDSAGWTMSIVVALRCWPFPTPDTVPVADTNAPNPAAAI